MNPDVPSRVTAQSVQTDVLPLAGARNRLLREELALEQPGCKPTYCEGNHLSDGKLQKIIFCYSGNTGLTFTMAKPI